MFKNWIRKMLGAPRLSTVASAKVELEAAPSSLEAASSQDPLFGVKKEAKKLPLNCSRRCRRKRGIHLESLLSALGALAGYACQVSVREVFVVQQGRPEKKSSLW